MALELDKRKLEVIRAEKDRLSRQSRNGSPASSQTMLNISKVSTAQQPEKPKTAKRVVKKKKSLSISHDPRAATAKAPQRRIEIETSPRRG